MTPAIDPKQVSGLPSGWVIGNGGGSSPPVEAVPDIHPSQIEGLPKGWTVGTAANSDAKISPYTGLPEESISSGKGPTLSPDATTIGDSKEGGAGFLTNLRAGLAPDVNDQIKRFASVRFPDLPIEQAVRRYGVVDGNIVYADPETNSYVRETPSVSAGNGLVDKALRAGDKFAANLGPMTPQIAGTVAGALTAETGLGSIPAAAATAGLVDMGRQALDRKLAGENPTDINYWNSAGHAAEAGIGQGIGVGIAKALNSNPLGVDVYDRAAALNPTLKADAAALQARGKDLGVDLSAGQATDLRSLQARERQLLRYPETQDTMQGFTDTQRQQQVPNAFRGFLEDLSPNYAPGEESVAAFKQGANQIVESEKNALSAQAKASYGRAFEAQPYWDKDLDVLMKRPVMSQAWKQAQTIAANEGRELPQVFIQDEAGNITGTKAIPDWQTMDYLKKGIDQILSSPANTNQVTGRVNASGNAINQAKKSFLGILDNANPDYASARSLYGSDIGELKATLAGPAGKIIRNLDQPNTDVIINRVFNPDNFTGSDIASLRGKFVQANKLEQWNAGVSNWLGGKLNDAMSSAINPNVPAKLYRGIWQDPRQANLIKSALGGKGDAVTGLENLMQVLQAAGKGLPEGSPTATDAFAMGPEGIARSIGGTAKTLSKMTSVETYLNPGKTLMEAYATLKSSPEANIKLADALLNGDVGKQLSKLSLLSPKSKGAAIVASHLLANAGITATGARTPSDFAAPIVIDGTTPPNPLPVQ